MNQYLSASGEKKSGLFVNVSKFSMEAEGMCRMREENIRT